MVERKLSTKKYLLAFFLTVIVFFGGILIGILLENARLEDTKEITLTDKVNLQSLQIQQKYIASGVANCESLNKLLENNIDDLNQKMALIIDYDKKSIFSQEEFKLQLRDYFLTEIQFLLTSQEIDRACGRDNVKIVYFYDESTDDTQGSILDYIKKLFGTRVLVFSFNSQFAEEPMIKVLLTSYGIEKFPSLVVDNKVYQGHTDLETLMKVVCFEFEQTKQDLPQECQLFNSAQ